MALLLGSAFSVLLFAMPVETFLADLSAVRNLSLAVSVGLLILAMAITDTEHPPAAGTVLGMGTRPWELDTTGIIIGAVLMLAVFKVHAPLPFAGPDVVLLCRELLQAHLSASSLS